MAVQDLWESKNRVQELRSKASLTGNSNIFDKVKQQHMER